jgi:hypothetical protein
VGDLGQGFCRLTSRCGRPQRIHAALGSAAGCLQQCDDASVDPGTAGRIRHIEARLLTGEANRTLGQPLLGNSFGSSRRRTTHRFISGVDRLGIAASAYQ